MWADRGRLSKNIIPHSPFKKKKNTCAITYFFLLHHKCFSIPLYKPHQTPECRVWWAEGWCWSPVLQESFSSSRTRYRESSHWPPPSWRWLKGQITRSDHCTMWSSGCFICQTSCSTDARYIDVPVKTRYLLEWGYKKVCWPHTAGAENTEIVTVKPSRSIPVRIVLDGWFHASNLIGQRRSPAVWITPIKLSALGCCYCFAGRFPVTMGRPCS